MKSIEGCRSGQRRSGIYRGFGSGGTVSRETECTAVPTSRNRNLDPLRRQRAAKFHVKQVPGSFRFLGVLSPPATVAKELLPPLPLTMSSSATVRGPDSLCQSATIPLNEPDGEWKSSHFRQSFSIVTQ